MEPDKVHGIGHDLGHEAAHASGQQPNKQLARRNGAIRAIPRAHLNVSDLRELLRLMSRSDIAEITLEHEAGGLHLTLRKPAPVAPEPMPTISVTASVEETGIEMAEEVEQVVAAGSSRESESAFVEVRSPLVGVFRSAMKEHGKPLVRPDETVRQGQVVAAIEALNVFNEVEVSTAGRVTKVLVADGQPVEYGQPLLLIEPKVSL